MREKGIKNLYLYLLVVSAFLSITLFEALIILYLLYYVFYSIKNRSKPTGKLFLPLTLYAVPTFLSTLIYTPQHIGKGVERSFFLLSYDFGKFFKANEELLYNLCRLYIAAGILLMPVVIFKYYKTGEPAPVWGGWFEVGVFYSIFSLTSIALLLKTGNKRYILLFVIFTGFVFFSARRSGMMGYGATLIILLWLLRDKASRKLLFSILLIFLTVSLGAFLYYSTKDVRFKTMLEVIEGKRKLNEETLNIISTTRWNIAKAGLKVIEKDIQNRNFLPLLIGHGVNSGYYLEPKSPTGATYESILVLSEPIEKGLLGLLGILWTMFSYYWIVLRRKLNDPLEIPFLLTPSILFVGSIFTGFWDALLPLYLILFRVMENALESE